jgi:multimeric flavodoxin WrbA
MIAQRFLDKAAILGAETETFSLNTLSYRGCQACYACKTKLDRCILKDDLSRVLDAVQESDVLVLATPTYYGDISGQLKCFVDRTYSYLKPDYLSNSQPSRLLPGKKLLFIITQGHPDEAMFDHVFPLYDRFFRWYGYVES